MLLDDTNVRLLGELHANPRITMSAPGKARRHVAPAVTGRVQRLEQAGVVLGPDPNWSTTKGPARPA